MRIDPGRLALALGSAAFVIIFMARLEIRSDLIAAEAAEVEETPKEIIADQIRRQGFSCDNPLSAERDLERSKPDAAVWTLKCENATYRVRLIPDMAAVVERVD